jgi:hypothetical protein
MNSYLYLVAGEEDEYPVWYGLADAEDQPPHLVLKAQRFRVPVRRVQIPACKYQHEENVSGIMVNIIHVALLKDGEMQ